MVVPLVGNETLRRGNVESINFLRLVKPVRFESQTSSCEVISASYLRTKVVDNTPICVNPSSKIKSIDLKEQAFELSLRLYPNTSSRL